MKTLFIPWQEFLEALKKQHPSSLETWLRRWHFTDQGVILAEVKSGVTAPREQAAPSLRA